MEFRRSGQSNQRRRRVLKDDPSAASEDGAPENGGRRGRGTSPLRMYSDHALAEHQLRVTDLIPQRAWTFLVLALSGLLVIAAVQTLFLHHAWGERLVGRHNLGALDPTRTGSIAGWVSSMLLGLAAINGVLVFSLRRHKIDDYRGRYRIWLPVAGLLLLASLDASTGLHRAGRGLVDAVAAKYGAGTSLGAAPHFWWVASCLFGVTLLFGRLSVEMRHSRAAMTKLVLAYGAYVALALVEWNVLAAGWGDLTVVAASVARLCGDLAFCLATASYSRYVYLDAQGIIAARRLAREKRRRQAAAEKAARKEARLAQSEAKKQAAAEAREAAVAAKKQAALEKQEKRGATITRDADEEDSSESAKPEKAPAPVPAKATSTKPEPADGRGSAPTAKPGPLAGRGSAAVDDDAGDDDEDDEEGDGQMSRAERRRLKKLQRRENRKAA